VTALAVGTTALVAWGSGTAHASPESGVNGGGTTTGNGYGAYAISVTGDVSGERKASVPSPPPLCWWEPWELAGDPTDPEAVKKYWFEELAPHLKGHAAAGNLAIAGSDEFDKAIEAAKNAPNGVTWYALQWNNDALPDINDNNAHSQALVDAGCTTTNRFADGGGVYQMPVQYQWFPTGQQPEPSYDPRAMAEYAYDVMDLVEPELGWNPKIGERGNAALVNLPTWLWVEDEQAVLGEGPNAQPGEKTVRATAGPVEVVVTARTKGLRIVSPAGSRDCSVDEARTRYQRGRDEADACTLAFTRGSYGYPKGFPVDASLVWDAAWTSNVGEADTLPSRTVGETTFIRVAQSQALVTEVD